MISGKTKHSIRYHGTTKSAIKYSGMGSDCIKRKMLEVDLHFQSCYNEKAGTVSYFAANIRTGEFWYHARRTAE